MFTYTSILAGFIPGDPFAFVIQLSEQLAEFAPQLTLDFIHEICAAMTTMDKAAVAQRISCLHYLSPWIRNLSQFANPTSTLYDKSGTRLRDCIRTLADLSLSFPEASRLTSVSIFCLNRFFYRSYLPCKSASGSKSPSSTVSPWTSSLTSSYELLPTVVASGLGGVR